MEEYKLTVLECKYAGAHVPRTERRERGGGGNKLFPLGLTSVYVATKYIFLVTLENIVKKRDRRHTQ